MAIHIGVDVGGTFTDFSVVLPAEGRHILHKVPSTPDEPDRAILSGLRDLIDHHGVDPALIGRFAHGTTVGTNALIQRRVGRVAMLTTKGFRDLLEIGRQTRPRVYDIHTDNPKPLVPRWSRYEVAERMRADGTVHLPLDEDGVRSAAAAMARDGVDCVAVCFLHAHAFPDHEDRAAAILRDELGPSVPVITSAMVYPEFREYERFSTTVLNAALLTVMDAYLDRFAAGLKRVGAPRDPMISQSGGGLMSVDYARRFPIRSALSGPAAGVLGAAERGAVLGERNVITLDIGGTSADVSLLADGEPATVFSRHLAGFPLRLPALDVNAVGAGGGSVAWIDTDGLLKVGPHSAGAVPGPACYGQGGAEATVTDANVLLGRLQSGALLDGRMQIRRDLAEHAIDGLAGTLGMGRDDTALGIVQVACATIVKAIRGISVERGHDPSGFALYAFGGAGPLHSVDVARELGIRRVVIPPNPGILCAEGLLASDLTADMVQPALGQFDPDQPGALNAALAALEDRASEWFAAETVEPDARHAAWTIDLRYAGQNFELAIPFDGAPFDTAALQGLRLDFEAAHDAAYGFALPDEPVESVALRVKLTGRLDHPPLPRLDARPDGAPEGEREVCFGPGDWRATPVFRRDTLAPGQQIAGPAIIEQMDSTTIVFPGDNARVDAYGNLIIDLGAGRDGA